MYIATAYIGSEYTPGEILPDNLDKGLLQRLIRAGAVKVTAPDPAFRAAKPEPETEDEAPETEPETEPAEEAEEETEEEPEEAYEEPEAPEVDVTAALVQEPKKGGTRKGAKK